MQDIQSTEELQQKCHICDKFFENLELHFVSSHMKEELGDGILSKDEQLILRENININENTVKDSDKCKLCGKNFSRKGNLKTHIKFVHEGIKEHKCNLCGKSFTSSKDLKRHTKAVHELIKDQKCNYCGKSYSDAGKHVRTVHQGTVFGVK